VKPQRSSSLCTCQHTSLHCCLLYFQLWEIFSSYYRLGQVPHDTKFQFVVNSKRQQHRVSQSRRVGNSHSKRQLQISGSKDYGCQNFNFALNFPNMEFFSHKFCIFGQNFLDNKTFRQFFNSIKSREAQRHWHKRWTACWQSTELKRQEMDSSQINCYF